MSQPVIVCDIQTTATDVWQRAGYQTMVIQECSPELSAALVEQVAEIERFVIDIPIETWRNEIARRLGRHRCQWVFGAATADETAAAIAEAQTWPVEGVITVADMDADIDTIHREGLRPGLSTGWASLDRYFTVSPGRVTVIGGSPTHGKSEIAEALFINLTLHHGWKFALYSPEHEPYALHFSRLASKMSAEPMRNGFNGHPKMSTETLEKCKDLIGRHYFWMAAGKDGMTFDRLVDMAEQMVVAHGIQALVIDPWNELTLPREPGINETETIGECLRRLKRLSRSTGLHVFILAHPNKMQRDKRTGQYPPPSLYDLAGSAHFRNRVDWGITVYRPSFKAGADAVDIIIGKAKWRHEGTTGACKLRFLPWSGQYADDLPQGADWDDQGASK